MMNIQRVVLFRHLLAVALALPILAAVAGPNAEIQRKTVTDKDGRTLTEVSRLMQFPHATLTSVCRLDGETFESGGGLGLEFGRLPKTNGGWNLWSFFVVHLLSGERVPLTSEPVLFQASTFGDAVVGDMVWEVAGKDGALETVSLRIIQEYQDPNWMFLRVDVASTGRVDYLSLSAYPGNPRSAVFPKEGERWVATRDRQHCLSQAAFTAPVHTDVMVWYNVYAYENTGCIVVVDPTTFNGITVSGDYGVGAKLVPAPGKTTFDIAIGQFMTEPASSFLPRFFGEQADAVRERLRNVDWNPKISPDRFARQAVLTEKLLAELDDVAEAFQEEFEALRVAYGTALSVSDSRAALAAANALDDLNDRIAVAGLKAFR